jgi:hypothetical protein
MYSPRIDNPKKKKEFAYQLLLCIPISKTLNVVDRLSPLLHRDFISVRKKKKL